LPDSLTKIHIYNIEIPSLDELKGLIKEINFTNFKMSRVKNMENMFKGCKLLSFLDLSNFDTSSVTSMAGMFQGCENLDVLDLSNFVFNKVINCDNMINPIRNNLRYISLINVQFNGEEEYEFSNIPHTHDLLVCNYWCYYCINMSCEKNNNSLFCKTNNYITVKYIKKILIILIDLELI